MPFVTVDLDGLVPGDILDFGSINRLVIVCRVALLIGNRKGLGNRGALLFKRYRGIELRGIKRHGAIDVLLSLKGRCSFGGVDRHGLHSLVLLELLRRALTCRLGCLLLSDSSCSAASRAAARFPSKSSTNFLPFASAPLKKLEALAPIEENADAISAWGVAAGISAEKSVSLS